MAEFGWGYISCGGLLTASGPTGSVQFRHGDLLSDGTYYTSITGSSMFTFNSSSNNVGIGLGHDNPGARLEISASAADTPTLIVDGNSIFSGSLDVQGNVHVSGTVFATEYQVQHITALSASGDSKFGDSAGDIHEFTGSVRIFGNLSASNGMQITDHVQHNNGLSNFNGNRVTFNSDVTASNGLLIPDDTLLRFGTSAGDATIEYDENGTDELRFAGAAVTFEQAVTFDANVTLGDAAGDVTTVTGKLTASNGAYVAGNVGLGTSTPGGPLHIYKAAAASNHTPMELLRLEQQDEGVDMDAGHGPMITFYVGETGGSDHGGSVAVVREAAGDADSAAAMSFYTAGDDSAPTEKMRITSTGKVGIGVTDPDTQLEVLSTSTQLKLSYDGSNYSTLAVGSGGGLTIDASSLTVATDLTASNGLTIPDDVMLRFGNASGGDVYMGYDESGDDVLKIQGAPFKFKVDITASNGITIPDDVMLRFGNATGGDVYMGYDESGDDVLKIQGAPVKFKVDVTASNGLTVPDDTLLRFGNGSDATIEYDENGTDELRFAGAAVTFEQAVTFDANVTLGNAVTDVTTISGQLTASNGVVITNHVTHDNLISTFTSQLSASNGLHVTDHVIHNNGISTFNGTKVAFDTDVTASNGIRIPDDTLLRFGVGAGDATIEYDENGTDELRFAGAAVTFEQAVSFDANVTLGDAASDVTTVTGKLTASNGMLITGDLLPGADNVHDLGASGSRWKNIYTGDLHLKNERGDWTIVEESDYLSVRNNKTGKLFKLVLEEVDEE